MYSFLSYGDNIGDSKSESAPVTLSKIQDEFAHLIENFLPSVVNIEVTWEELAQESSGDNDFLQDFLEGFLFRDKESSGQRRGFRGAPRAPQKQKMASQGSGFIIGSKASKDGKQKIIHVVTNRHVIAGALKRNSSSAYRPGAKVKVRLQSGVSYEAEILGSDLMCDIAVLAFKSEDSHPILSWGDSSMVKQGHFALAAGNPFGLGGTVTVGRISYKNREFGADTGDTTEGPDLFLQSDAAMNRGNSGGPLLNIQGKVIGVNTAIFSPTGTYAGISFSVPSVRAKIVVDQIIESGFVHRGVIGVFLHPRGVSGTEHMTKGMRGVLIKEVSPGSSADKKGVRAGDIILSVNGTLVKHWIQVRSIIGFVKPGQSVKLTLLRGKNKIDIDVPVESFSSDTLQRSNQFMGVAFGLSSGKLKVQHIEEDSLWKNGLIVEDEILRLGDQEIKDPKLFIDQLNQLQEKGVKRVIITLKRKEKEISIILPLNHGGEYESS
ncbi:trypsin-like peptidase domain-containing protein [Holospora curviuscula]|nr:trypsin-like peptidase domain-containing protein [Holospora curviuscula]